MAKTVFIAVLIILMSNLVLALGIGPSRQYMSFAPGQKIQGELVIINDAKADFKAAVYVEGDLSEHVRILKPLVDVAATDHLKRVTYEIDFPISPPKPGEHELKLIVRQFPPEAKVGGDTTISASMAVMSQIIVKVPFPGKYADGRLFVTGADNDDQPTKFTINIQNFGTEDIQDAHATIEVFTPSWEKIGEVQTQSIAIKSKQESKVAAEWKTEAEKGTYRAVATVHFDDKQFRLEQMFDLGTFMIDVSDISVEKFRLGDVAKFDILLFNSWNTKIDDVYVEMIVEDSKGRKMTESKTAAVTIPPHEGEQLEAYWYTEGAAPGIYTVKLIVHYAGRITQKEYDFEVSTNSITQLGAVGQAVAAEEQEDMTSQGVIILLILIVLVLLIGMNIVWFYYLSKKIKGKGGEK